MTQVKLNHTVFVFHCLTHFTCLNMSHHFLCEFSSSKRHKDDRWNLEWTQGRNAAAHNLIPSRRNETVALTKLYKILLYAADYWPSENQTAFALFGNWFCL